MDFHAWLQQRTGPLPDADRLLLLIQQAGAAGIPEGKLRAAVELPKQVVDGLLAALVTAGQVTVVERGGRMAYVSR